MIRCDYLMLSRDRRSYDTPCPHRAKFTVVSRDRNRTYPWQAKGPYACGRHVRPALMDNGDSVWKPWIVTVLEEK